MHCVLEKTCKQQSHALRVGSDAEGRKLYSRRYRSVCTNFWAAAYGVTGGTCKQIRSDERAQRLQSVAE
eukprot:5816274-Pleurochrysis_carterae.AAC.1